MAVKRTSRSEHGAQLDALIELAGIIWDGHWYVHTEIGRLGPFETYEEALLAGAKGESD